MALLDHIAQTGTAERHRPWPRVVVAEEGWLQAIDLLAAGRCTLLGLWGEVNMVNMAVMADTFDDFAVLTYTCNNRQYPGVGAKYPPALRLERAIRDLFGLDAGSANDLSTGFAAGDDWPD